MQFDIVINIKNPKKSSILQKLFILNTVVVFAIGIISFLAYSSLTGHRDKLTDEMLKIKRPDFNCNQTLDKVFMIYVDNFG